MSITLHFAHTIWKRTTYIKWREIVSLNLMGLHGRNRGTRRKG
jgi:hypothetical protein